jgi:hypothetical protein
MKEAAEKNAASTITVADGGSGAAWGPAPPPTAAAVRNIIRISHAHVLAVQLGIFDNACEQFKMEKGITGARAVSELRDVIGRASTVLVREVTWAFKVTIALLNLLINHCLFQQDKPLDFTRV